MTNYPQDLYFELAAFIENLPKISTHCHQLPAKEYRGFDLESLLRNSYVNWCGVPWNSTAQSHHNLLEKVRFNSFFVWLQKSLQQLYGITAPLSGTTWQEWSERIQVAYQNPSHPRDVLTRRCLYRRMVLDAYWDPGSDNGFPDFFVPIFRINSFFFGYSPRATDHDGNNPYLLYPRPFILDLDEYVAWVRDSILEHKASGCVALKIPLAYDRGLDFCEVSPDQARASFSNLVSAYVKEPLATMPTGEERVLPSNAQDPFSKQSLTRINAQEIKEFQDHLFFQVCSIAAEEDMPIQIHTGMGQAHSTNASQLQGAIQRFPHTRFVLLHCSYPWIQDISMLVDKYPNVSPDLSMLPIISTRASIAMLHDLIERSTSDRIAWGCDTWTPEESYAALLAFRHLLATALAEKVNEGYLSREDAVLLIKRILFDNPNSMYKLGITQ
jgi:predicted TIM-barrel fold metal-dependent hydrolase